MPQSVSLKHLLFLNQIFRNPSYQSFCHDVELKCSNGSLLYNKLLVGLLFPHLSHSQEYQLSLADVLLLPEFTMHEIYQKFNEYFPETNNEIAKQSTIEEEVCEQNSVEEIITEFVVEDHTQGISGEVIAEDESSDFAMGEPDHQVDINSNGEGRNKGPAEQTCEECGDVFRNYQSLRIHIELLHKAHPKAKEKNKLGGNNMSEGGSKTREKFSCSVCGKTFKFRTHMQNHENTHLKPFKCGVCHEMFAEDNKLASHELNVHGHLVNGGCVKNSLMKCSFCPKVFPARSQLVLHERTHTKERPFQCSQCQKTFSAKCNLTAHERIHFGDSKRYECRHPPCSRKFSHTSERKDHETIHTGDRPYMCPLCGERYRRNANLWRHKQKCGGAKNQTSSGEKGTQGKMEEVDSKMIVEEDTDFVVHDPSDNSTTKYEIVFVDTEAGPSRRAVGGQERTVQTVVSEQVVIA